MNLFLSIFNIFRKKKESYFVMLARVVSCFGTGHVMLSPRRMTMACVVLSLTHKPNGYMPSRVMCRP